jgi:hypothetical protein
MKITPAVAVAPLMLPCAAPAFAFDGLSVSRFYPQRPVYMAEMHFNAFEPPLGIEVD